MHDAVAAELTPATFVEIAKQRKWAVVHISLGHRAWKRGEHGHRLPEVFGKEAPLREYLDMLLDLEIPEVGWGGEDGSGFLIDSEGYILTSCGVVRQRERFKVSLLNGDEYKATLVGKDLRRHVALLKIDTDEPLPFIPLGESEALEVGEWVVALGNPLGTGEMLYTGVVSGTGRSCPAALRARRDAREYIATDAAAHPGSLGGPLLNLRGEAVGLNIGRPHRRSRGLGLAVPMDTVKAILGDLKLRGEVARGWLGVTIQPITPPLARYFHLSEEDEGVLVASVAPGSPAERAGLSREDVVVTFDGREVGEPEELSQLVADTPPGNEVTVEVIRGGERLSLAVTVGEAGGAGRPPGPATEIMGLTVIDITPQTARRLGMQEPRGVVVTAVEEGSPADRAGLREGDVIVEVNRTEVSDRETYEELLAGAEGESILFLAKRREGARFVVVQLD
jgi:serine protease Do